MSWQNIFRLLCSDAMRGWREYMTFMEEEIRNEVRNASKLVYSHPQQYIIAY